MRYLVATAAQDHAPHVQLEIIRHVLDEKMRGSTAQVATVMLDLDSNDPLQLRHGSQRLHQKLTGVLAITGCMTGR